jgi:hypothetical protein
MNTRSRKILSLERKSAAGAETDNLAAIYELIE